MRGSVRLVEDEFVNKAKAPVKKRMPRSQVTERPASVSRFDPQSKDLALYARDLTKTFSDVKALNDVSFFVKKERSSGSLVPMVPERRHP